jgi:Zn-finger nucleic acid-binding protein
MPTTRKSCPMCRSLLESSCSGVTHRLRCPKCGDYWTTEAGVLLQRSGYRKTGVADEQPLGDEE